MTVYDSTGNKVIATGVADESGTVVIQLTLKATASFVYLTNTSVNMDPSAPLIVTSPKQQ